MAWSKRKAEIEAHLMSHPELVNAPVGGPIWEEMPKRQSVISQVAGFLPFLNRIDTNKDGVITDEELDDFEAGDDDAAPLSDYQLERIAMALEARVQEVEAPPEPVVPALPDPPGPPEEPPVPAP